MKEKIKKIIKSIFVLPFGIGFIILGFALLILVIAVWGYVAGFLMYIFEILLVGIIVATVVLIPLHFLLKLILREELREKIEIAILLLILVVVVFWEIVALQKGGGFFQNFLYFLGDMIGSLP